MDDVPRRRMPAARWSRIGSLILAAWALRLCYLVVAYQFPGSFVRRPHIESGALLFGMAGFAFRFCTDVQQVTKPEPSSSPSSSLWLGFAAIALVMYWPAIFLG